MDEKKLPDDFSRLVLQGSLRVAADKENPIRMHLFAAGIRELFGHILHRFAPDDEVKACAWFVQAQDTNITRRQRATYATQGGLSDAFLETIHVDVSDLHDQAIEAIDDLNKATHVRPGRIEQDQGEIEAFVTSVLISLEGLINSFADCRSAVSSALEGAVYEAMMQATIEQTFDAIDHLAWKGYEIDYFLMDTEVDVLSIESKEISVRYRGIAPVTLFHGGKHDPVELHHDFPFWMIYTAPVAAPSQLKLKDHFFDDSGWYE